MRFVFMSLMAVSAFALNAQESDEPTGGEGNVSEVVVADDTSSDDEASAN